MVTEQHKVEQHEDSKPFNLETRLRVNADIEDIKEQRQAESRRQAEYQERMKPVIEYLSKDKEPVMKAWAIAIHINGHYDPKKITSDDLKIFKKSRASRTWTRD